MDRDYYADDVSGGRRKSSGARGSETIKSDRVVCLSSFQREGEDISDIVQIEKK